MAREPIVIGLDESPIVIQAKGVDWAFNPDPSSDFLIKMMQIAKSLQAGELGEFGNMATLLGDQLVDPEQRKKWNKADLGVGFTNAILHAYVEAVNNPLPTPPPSQSGKPRGGAGPK